jgi:hypothetical protein
MKILLDSSVKEGKTIFWNWYFRMGVHTERAIIIGPEKNKLRYFRKYDCQECDITMYDEDNILASPDEENTIRLVVL